MSPRRAIPQSLLLIAACILLAACGAPGEQAGVVRLRLGVALTPQELQTFEPAIAALDRDHPEWEIVLETTPQSGVIEKINTQLAGGTLPDVLRVQGLMVQRWIPQGAFLDLTERIQQGGPDLDAFYAGPLEQFRWQGKIWGLPDTAAPDVLFFNKGMFDAAGLPYPTDDWTYEDMREAAILLTLDEQGRNPTQPGFDPGLIQQWGWNGGLSNFWQRHLVRAFGGEFCDNDACTRMDFTSQDTLDAVRWWARLVQEDYAAPYDPYGGSQTGVPGDAFLAGIAAMGYNGFFAVGQLNEIGDIPYDIVQPLLAEDGRRYTPLSTNGYVISAASEFPEAAWALVQELIEPEFLQATWGEPGHSVPALRAAADSVIDTSHPPDNQAAIVAAMEYGEVFKPSTASAFEVHAKTADLFLEAMKGEKAVSEAMQDIESIANDVLARDLEP